MTSVTSWKWIAGALALACSLASAMAQSGKNQATQG